MPPHFRTRGQGRAAKAPPQRKSRSRIYKRKMHGEMRNPQAFQIQLGIQHKVFGKISFEKPAISRPEDIKRERVTAFFDSVNNFLELSKHGLPEKRAPQIVDLPVDNVGAHLRIARRFEQMIGEEFLVERRCNLSQKNRLS